MLEQLDLAVAHAFAVLQSLVSNRADERALRMSSEFVSCIALFLYLQGRDSKESMRDWQPFRVQERSARCTAPTHDLEPDVHPIATPPVLC